MKEFYIEKARILEKEFYQQKTDFVAQELLGKIIVRKFGYQLLAGMIVETEAYLAENDFANHSTISQTKRNAPMREEGGILYVYKIYGIHHCMNIVTEQVNKGCAVLVRALKPIIGIETMKSLRNEKKLFNLCKGPGNLSKAFNFTTDDNYKSVTDNFEIFILDINESPEFISDYRIGISKSQNLKLRYYIKSCNFVSGKKIG